MNDSSQVWLITGASRGLGREIALAALAAGQKVVVTARDLADLSEFAGRPDAFVLAHEAADAGGAARLVEHITEVMGAPSVLVNNAGAAELVATEHEPEDLGRRMMDLHYHGPFALIRAVLPAMRAAGRGTIVNIGAAAALANYPGFGAYGASKAALELATESLRAEVSAFGIRVLLVHPGPLRTGFAAGCLATRTPEPDYERSTGRFARTLAGLDGKQPGDPAAAAKLIVQTVLGETVPPRLPLGRYMVRKYRDKARTLLAEADALEALAAGADFEIPAAPQRPA